MILHTVINFVVYIVTLTMALVAAPYFAWTHELVNQENLIFAFVITPFVLASIWYAHDLLFTRTESVLRAISSHIQNTRRDRWSSTSLGHVRGPFKRPVFVWGYEVG